MISENVQKDIKQILYTSADINRRVCEIAKEIEERLGDTRPVIICVLKGATFFFVDLCRALNLSIDIDFISVSSYGENAKSTGVVKLIKDLDNNITNRDIVIVEDILDSGLTLEYLTKLLGARSPKSITTVAFLDKYNNHKTDFEVDIKGFNIENNFVVGYGLDYANNYRNLSYIGILDENCI